MLSAAGTDRNFGSLYVTLSSTHALFDSPLFRVWILLCGLQVGKVFLSWIYDISGHGFVKLVVKVFVVIVLLMGGLGVLSGLRIKKRPPGILRGRRNLSNNISEYYLTLIRDSKACSR